MKKGKTETWKNFNKNLSSCLSWNMVEFQLMNMFSEERQGENYTIQGIFSSTWKLRPARGQSFRVNPMPYNHMLHAECIRYWHHVTLLTWNIHKVKQRRLYSMQQNKRANSQVIMLISSLAIVINFQISHAMVDWVVYSNLLFWNRDFPWLT